MTVNVSLEGEFTGGGKGTGVKLLTRKSVMRSTDELGWAMTTHTFTQYRGRDKKAGHLKGDKRQVHT